MYLTPTLVLVLGWLLYRRAWRRAQVLGMAISYAGVLLVFGQEVKVEGRNVTLGALLVFASTVSYALYLVYSGEFVKRLGSLRLVGLATSVACLCCITQFLLLRPVASAFTVAPPVLALSVLNAILCTAVPVLLVMMAIERVGPAATAQAGMVGPLSTILLGVWLLEGRALHAGRRRHAAGAGRDLRVNPAGRRRAQTRGWGCAGEPRRCLSSRSFNRQSTGRHSMDFGSPGKWALVCGASKGLGFGCAQALAREGVHVVVVARGAEALDAAAATLRGAARRPARRCRPSPRTSPPRRAAPRCSPSARTTTSWSPTRAARRPATSATGTARPGSRRWTPTCSRPSR